MAHSEARVPFTEADLRRALTNHELLILYQAQVDMRTGRVAGMECAIRWDHPQRGRLHAVPFVDDVPPLGLASEYMRFIAHTTTRQFAVWRAAGVEIPRFAINAWPSSIAAELRDDILRCCEAAQLEPSCVEVETQPEALYDPRMLAELRAFQACGIRVALDDFGDGDLRYAWLRDAPFDVVKIGVAFGKNAGRTYDDAVITAAVAFARAIGAQTVVEGIETIALRDRARELGCDIGQGYLWSRQVTADEFPSTVRAIRVDGALA